jgi:hypothetical protein
MVSFTRIIMPYRYRLGGSPFQLFGSGKPMGSVNFGKLAKAVPLGNCQASER